MMPTELLAVLAALLFAIAAITIALRDCESAQRIWLLPAALLGFSLITVASEGPVALWEAHSRDLWANQIWFDLLLAIGTAWALIVPRARALGMRPLPWLALIVGTGSVGLLAMAARMLYLQNSTDRA